MREPVLPRIDPSAQPIMQLALSSQNADATPRSRAWPRTCSPTASARSTAWPTVNVNGSLRRELSVLLRAQKLREYNVSVTEVVNALRAQNTTAPVGRVKGELDEQSIRLVGRIESPGEFEDIVLKRRGNEIVRLGQVATVQDGFAEIAGYQPAQRHSERGPVGHALARREHRHGGRRACATWSRRSTRRCPRARSSRSLRTAARTPRTACKNVIEALIFGAGLTIFVVYAFLNSWRSTLITALSLPTSAIAAFIAVWACGFTLNFMTLLGLSLAIGVLIDDAIVVRENIVRHMERGEDRVTAARNGTAEIGLAVTATTFSIMAVFVPVAFMGGVAGEWFRPFAVTVATSVLVSLFISFTLDPMLSAYWGDPVGYQRIGRRRGLGKVLKQVQHVVRPPGRSLRQRHRLGAAPSQVDGRDRGGAAWALRWRCR